MFEQRNCCERLVTCCGLCLSNETVVRGWLLVVDYVRAPEMQEWSPQQDLFRSFRNFDLYFLYMS